MRSLIVSLIGLLGLGPSIPGYEAEGWEETALVEKNGVTEMTVVQRDYVFADPVQETWRKSQVALGHLAVVMFDRPEAAVARAWNKLFGVDYDKLNAELDEEEARVRAARANV